MGLRVVNLAAAILFITGLGLFVYMGVNDWLPALCLVVGFSVAIRQLLLGHRIDVLVSVIIFGIAFFVSSIQFFAKMFLPALLLVGAIYYIFRQFYGCCSPKGGKSHE